MPLYERVGRLSLLLAIALWWGGFVVPHLVSLTSSELLPLHAIPRQLNAEYEGTVANAFSALALSVVAFLALVNAAVSVRRTAGWPGGAGGWAALMVTSAYLAWEELSDFHVNSLTVVEQAVFGKDLVEAAGPFVWPVLLSPLIVAFLLVMWAFARKELRAREVRAPFFLGLAAWLLALVLEVTAPILFVFVSQAAILGYVLEETLEFSGTLLIALSAVFALRSVAASRPPSGGRRLQTTMLGSLIALAAFGGFFVVFVFRAPLVDARVPSYTHRDTFQVSLNDHEAVIQEIQMPAAPVGSLRLRLANCDLEVGSAVASVRVTRMGTLAPILSEGSLVVPAGDCPRWRDVELFPPFAEAEGQRLAVQVIADVEPGHELGIGATKMNHYEGGRLWVNGILSWPDQNLEFVAYGTAAPTRSKFQGLWSVLTSDWHWPVIIVEFMVALILITLIPALLITAALSPRRPPGPVHADGRYR